MICEGNMQELAEKIELLVEEAFVDSSMSGSATVGSVLLSTLLTRAGISHTLTTTFLIHDKEKSYRPHIIIEYNDGRVVDIGCRIAEIVSGIYLGRLSSTVPTGYALEKCPIADKKQYIADAMEKPNWYWSRLPGAKIMKERLEVKMDKLLS